jgi:integrase
MSVDTPGTWIARSRQSDGKQVFDSLGSLEDMPAHGRFDAAVHRVNEWLQGLEAAGPDKTVRTVEDACVAYVVHLRESRGDKAAADAQARYDRWVKSHPIAKMQLHQLTRDECREFRRTLATSPVLDSKGQTKRERSKDTVNRDMTSLRAALNFAFNEGKVKTDFAWRESLKPFPKAGRRRELYLDREQRHQLMAKADPDLSLFLQGLAAVPLRPGAVAALKVADFDRRLSTLKVGKDKHGQDRKLSLGSRVAQLFCESCEGKERDVAIFTRSTGEMWNKDSWKHPVKHAVRAAGLPEETTAYTLRHSIITDLVHDGLDLLSVAQISGTSVAMIEQHYGHLRGDLAAAALERVAVLRPAATPKETPLAA